MHTQATNCCNGNQEASNCSVQPERAQRPSEARSPRDTFAPRFDIWEGDQELVLYADLPGVEPDQLDIEFEKGQLMIRGKVNRYQDVKFLFAEYGIGDFYRSFTISDAINSEAITAELRDGVLTLRLPKAEAAKPRKVEVRS